MANLNTKTIKFYYNYHTRRPKRLENNVFIVYSPEKVILQSGEHKIVNMQIKIFLPKGIEGSCKLLLRMSNQKLMLLNSSVISQEYNPNITQRHGKNNYLPLINLQFDLFNGNYTNPIEIKKRQELGYFYLLNDREEEINFKFEKEKNC